MSHSGSNAVRAGSSGLAANLPTVRRHWAFVGCLVLGISIAFIGFVRSETLPTVLFVGVFLATFRIVFRRNFAIGIFYVLLFVYTFFTQLAYHLYPSQLVVVNGGQSFGGGVMTQYVIFVTLSFLAIFVALVIRPERASPRSFRVVPLDGWRRVAWAAFVVLVLGHTLVSAVNYALISETLSYSSQEVLKGNEFAFYTYYFHTVVLLVLYTQLRHPDVAKRIVSRLLFVLNGAVFLVATLRSGQRIELASLVLACLAYSYLSTEKTARVRFLFKAAAVLCSLLALGFAIRFTRGPGLSVTDFTENAAGLFGSESPFTLENLVLEDYSGPSLVLANSIESDVVVPRQVILSVVGNVPIKTAVPTLGEVISKRIDPSGETGFGYYLLAEGFNAMGWWGFVYNAAIFVIGLRLWSLLVSRSHRDYDFFVQALIVLGVFDIVRGQSSFFFKGFAILLLPGVFTYLAANGLRFQRSSP